MRQMYGRDSRIGPQPHFPSQYGLQPRQIIRPRRLDLPDDCALPMYILRIVRNPGKISSRVKEPRSTSPGPSACAVGKCCGFPLPLPPLADKRTSSRVRTAGGISVVTFRLQRCIGNDFQVAHKLANCDGQLVRVANAANHLPSACRSSARTSKRFLLTNTRRSLRGRLRQLSSSTGRRRFVAVRTSTPRRRSWFVTARHENVHVEFAGIQKPLGRRRSTRADAEPRFGRFRLLKLGLKLQVDLLLMVKK